MLPGLVRKLRLKKDERQDLLSDELFVDPRSANRAGYRKLQSTIEAEYIEFSNVKQKEKSR